MLGRQKQVWEAFIRVQDWLTRHAPPEGTAIARVFAEYREVMARVERAGAHQVRGRREKLGATRALRAAVRTLRVEHLWPLSVIGRATRDESFDCSHACRLPNRRLPVTKLLAEAGAIRSLAERWADRFILYGRSADFVARLDMAIDSVIATQRRRDRALSLQVGATAGLQAHLGRARKLVEVLDCHVTSAFANDEAKLAEWRVTRRVRLMPGASHEVAAPEVRETEQAATFPTLTMVA